MSPLPTQQRPALTYVRLPDGRTTVACRCGWTDPLGPVPPSPFDPAEALVAARVAHSRCPDDPPRR